ncbi:MAG: NUDIX domain-containing protein, partial [Methylotenera sp.]
ARHFLIEGWPSSPKVEKQLWALAEDLLPKQGMVAYTQGLMDLGATLCTRSKPKCTICPLNNSCEAYRENRVNELPTPKPRKAIPEKHITMLILLHGKEVMLEKRPSTGIWGGLWSFPEVETDYNTEAIVLSRFAIHAEADEPLARLSHAFTHFKLHIQPQPLHVVTLASTVCLPKVSEAGQIWLSIEDAVGAAIPTPVRKILQSLQNKPFRSI